MADNSKILAVVEVLIPIVALVVLLVKKDDAYLVYYAKQSLVLAVLGWVGMMVSMLLMVVLIGLILFPIVSLAWFILVILGILNAWSGQQKPLPFIGTIWK